MRNTTGKTITHCYGAGYKSISTPQQLALRPAVPSDFRWPKQRTQWSVKDRALVGITATEEYHQQRREIGHHLGDIPRIGNGELTVEFRQPFDLIAFGTAELKQKKAAGVGSDDLHQFKYTPEDSNL